MSDKNLPETLFTEDDAMHFSTEGWDMGVGLHGVGKDAHVFKADQLGVRTSEGLLHFSDNPNRTHVAGVGAVGLSMSAEVKTSVDSLRASLRVAEAHGSSEEVFGLLKKLVSCGFSNPLYVADCIAYADKAFECGFLEEAFKAYKEVLQKKRDHPKALDGLQRFLEIPSYEEEACKVLEPLYTVQHNDTQLALVLERRLAYVEDIQARKTLLRRIADVYSTRLKNPSKAFEMAYRASTEDFSDPGVRLWMEKSALSLQDMKKAAQLYEEKGLLEEGSLGVVFLKKAASYCTENLRDPVSASRVLRALWDRNPADEKTSLELKKAYTEAGLYDALLDVLKKELFSAPSEDKRRTFFDGIKHVLFDVLNNASLCVDTYEDIKKHFPQHIQEWSVLERLYIQEQKWQSLIGYYDDLISLSDAKDEKNHLVLKKAQILSERLLLEEDAVGLFVQYDLVSGNVREEALFYAEEKSREGSYCWTVFFLEYAMSSGIEEAFLTCFERYVFFEHVQEKVFLKKLEAYTYDQKHWKQHAYVLERLVGLSGSSEEKSAFLEKLFYVYKDFLNDSVSAEKCVQNILHEDPSHLWSLKRMESLYAETGEHVLLCENITKQIEKTVSVEEKIRLYSVLGNVFSEEMNDFEKAIGAWEHALSLDPSHQSAFYALEVLYPAENAWESLLSLYCNKVSSVESATERVRVYAKMAFLSEEKTKDRLFSCGCWEKVLQEDPGNKDAVDALYRLCGLLEDGFKKAEICDALYPFLEGDKKLKACMCVLENKVFSETHKEKAYAAACEAMLSEECDAETMHALCVFFMSLRDVARVHGCLNRYCLLETLEEPKIVLCEHFLRLVGDHDAYSDLREDVWMKLLAYNPSRRDVYVVLLDSFYAHKKWPLWMEYVQKYIDCADVDERKKWIRDKIHVCTEFLGEHEWAFLDACKAYREDPKDRSVFELLCGIACRCGLYEECISVCEEAVGLLESKEDRVYVLKKEAFLYEEGLQDALGSLRVLERIKEEGVLDAELFEKAILLCEKSGGLEASFEWMHAYADMLTDDGHKKNLYKKAYALSKENNLGYENCYAYLYKAHVCDEKDVSILDELSLLCEENGFLEQSIEWIEKKHVILGGESDISLDECLRIAYVYEEASNHEDKALYWYEKAYDKDGTHVVAYTSLERFYKQQNKKEDLISLYEKRLSCLDAFSERKEVLLGLYDVLKCEQKWDLWFVVVDELLLHAEEDMDENYVWCVDAGCVLRDVLKRVSDSERYFLKALSFRPDSGYVLNVLAETNFYLEKYEQSISYYKQSMVGLKEEEMADVWCCIGDVYRKGLLDLENAKFSYEKAVLFNPLLARAVSSLKEILFECNDENGYVECLLKEIACVESSSEKAPLYGEIGCFYKNKKEYEKALSFYEQSVAACDDGLKVWLDIADVCFEMRAWEDCAKAYASVFERLKGDENVSELMVWYLKAGQSYVLCGVYEKAFVCYEKAYGIDPLNAESVQGYGDILFRMDMYEESLCVYRAFLSYPENTLTASEKAHFFVCMGGCFEGLGDFSGAMDSYEEAVSCMPNHTQAWERLGACCNVQGMYEKAYTTWESSCELFDVSQRGDIYQKMYEVAHEKLHHPLWAIQSLEKMCSVRELDVDVLCVLARLYAQEGFVDKALDVYEEVVSKTTSMKNRSDVLCEMGTLCALSEGYASKALGWYQASLEAWPYQVKAVSYVQKALASEKQWSLLEKHFQWMIGHTQDASVQVQYALWKDLAELYRTVMKLPEKAATAYEVLVRMDAKPTENTSFLADAYRLLEDKKHLSYGLKHVSLMEDKNIEDGLRVLKTWCLEDKTYDGVYLLCDALSFMKKASEEEKNTAAYLSKGLPSKPTSFLDTQDIQSIVPWEAKNATGVFFETVYRMCGSTMFKGVDGYGFKKRDTIDTSSERTFFAGVCRYVVSFLGMSNVSFYRSQSASDGVQILPSYPPCVVVGSEGGWLSETSFKKLSFMMGKKVFSLHPSVVMGVQCKPHDLRDLLLGLVSVYQKHISVESAKVDGWKTFFSGVSMDVLKKLQPYVRDAYEEYVSSEGGSVESYARACVLGCYAAGVVCSSDLSAAWHVAQKEASSLMLAEDVMKSVLLFYVSSDHLKIREKVGLALNAGKEDRT